LADAIGSHSLELFQRRAAAIEPPRRRFLNLAAGVAALAALPRAARAQAYPARPVRMIVPFAPGGPTDVVARLVARDLSERLGKQFFVENMPGASGNIGTAQAARAAPDGYTLLVAVNSHVINPTLFDHVPYDPIADFEPVALAVTFATALAVHPSVPARSVRELVALVKADPGKYSFASPGTGTPSHLLGEQFRMTLGLDIVHVPFGGSGPAMSSVMAGHTPIGFAALSAAAPYAKDGKLEVLAVLSKSRSETLPDVPTMAQAGYAGLEGDGWVGILVPAKTPKDIVNLLNREMVAVITNSEMKTRLAEIGFAPSTGSPGDFARQMKSEGETWSRIIRAAKIKAE
jgi:tripartite-type tricarboxylate transporter receptor subunit TctC